MSCLPLVLLLMDHSMVSLIGNGKSMRRVVGFGFVAVPEHVPRIISFKKVFKNDSCSFNTSHFIAS